MVLTRAGDIWERVAPLIAGFGIVVCLAVLGAVAIQQHINSETIANNTRLLNEHTITLREVAQLRQEVTTEVKLAGPELVAGQKALLASLSWIECAVSSGAASCGAPPS